MRIHGACHCGANRYEADIDPATVVVCHCSDCQALSGAPFRASVPARESAVAWQSRALRDYTKTADSGRGRVLAFCPTCGSQLYSTSTGTPGDDRVLMLRTGCIAERARLVPMRQIWCASKLPWVDALATVAAAPPG